MWGTVSATGGPEKKGYQRPTSLLLVSRSGRVPILSFGFEIHRCVGMRLSPNCSSRSFCRKCGSAPTGPGGGVKPKWSNSALRGIEFPVVRIPALARVGLFRWAAEAINAERDLPAPPASEWIAVEPEALNLLGAPRRIWRKVSISMAGRIPRTGRSGRPVSLLHPARPRGRSASYCQTQRPISEPWPTEANYPRAPKPEMSGSLASW